MDSGGILIQRGKALKIRKIHDELCPLISLKRDDSILHRLEALLSLHPLAG